MATIAENLVALHEAKANIKTTLESQGQDLTDVPFTQYSDKVNDIVKGLLESSSKRVVIPEGTSSIHQYCFNGNTNLQEIIIPSSVQNIGNYAFANCTNLQSANIETTTENMGNYTFSNCENLKNVSLPENLTTMTPYMFNYCTSLSEITIPSGVISIQSYVFRGCSSLTSVIIPKSVVTLLNAVFQNCTALTSIVLPSVTEIGVNAFNGCSNLLKVVFGSELTVVPTLKNVNAFTSINANCKIYVPDALYDTWITATNWSTYASKIVKLSEMPTE